MRWAALVLMVGTAFKIFFMDLWRLGQLHRVASFETVKPQDRLRLDFIGLETFQSGVVALHYRKHT